MKTRLLVNLCFLVVIVASLICSLLTPMSDGIGGSVPFYSQRDSAWRTVELNGNCLPPCNTIGTCGCAVTSVAMVFTHFGARHDPSEMNDCLGGVACPLAFELAAQRCGKGMVNWIGRYSFSWWRLEQFAEENKLPVILGLTRKGNDFQTHFVVITKGKGYDVSGYFVHDPDWINGRNMPLATTLKEWEPRWLIVYRGYTR